MDVTIWHIPPSLRVISVDASRTTAAFGGCVMRANESAEKGRSKKEREREGGTREASHCLFDAGRGPLNGGFPLPSPRSRARGGGGRGKSSSYIFGEGNKTQLETQKSRASKAVSVYILQRHYHASQSFKFGGESIARIKVR